MAIGEHVRHPEWDQRTSGAIHYTRDVLLEGALVGKILRSPHAHARILAIDTTAAKRIEGVAAVLTAADLPERLYKDYGSEDRPALARDVVSHFGQEVAIVAAETEHQANRALAAIRIRYRPLPAVVDGIDALRPGAALVHPERSSDNVANTLRRRFGDPEEARAQASHRTRARYKYGVQAHACMEPQSTLASWDKANATLDVWTPTQSARSLQTELAHMLGLNFTQVRLRSIAVGGDFGSRVRASDIEVLAATLSMRAARPVVISLTRADEFAFTKHQHETWIELETGVDSSGSVTFRDADITVANGAFTHGGSNMMSYCSILLGTQYRLAGAEMTGRSVYINRRSGGSFRGAGGPQAIFAIESQMDEIAGQLGLDPIDFRLKNINEPGQRTITGWEIGSAHIAECIAAVKERLNWDEARGLTGSGRGVGIAIAMHPSGAIVSPATARAEAVVEIGRNGGISLASGCSDPGTGETTLIAQICAQELGVPIENIDITVMDTALTPVDPGAGASRATYITGNAVRVASQAIAAKLRECAAAKLGVGAAEVTLSDGYARANGKSLPLGELVSDHPDSTDGVLRVQREHVAEVPIVPMAAGDPGFGNLSPCYGFAAHGAEVEVDAETGTVRVIRVVAAHDAGTIINPVGARSQVIGGVAMGVGAAIGEQLLFQGGRPVVTSYIDYAMPRATDAPAVEVVFVGEASPRGPYGAKALAEIALMPTAAAVANAVAHATGIRVRSLPISPDKIVNAMRGRQVERDWSLWRRPSRWWSAAVRWAYPRGLHEILHRWSTAFAQGQSAPHSVAAVLHPDDTDAAVAVLAGDQTALAVGGGTDVLVASQQGLIAPAILVDLKNCKDLVAIAEDDSGALTIGGAVKLATAVRHLRDSARPGDRALVATIGSIASPQIRESATIAGNLCQKNRCWFYRSGFNCYKRGGTACPCYAVTGDHRYFHAILDAHRCQSVTPSDLATTLTALDAYLVVKGKRGIRRLPVAALYSGPGETVLRRDEIIQSVTVPAESRNRAAGYDKLSLSEGGFAIASACVSLSRDDGGAVLACRVVLGGIANRPYRALAVERALMAAEPSAGSIEGISRTWTWRAHPLKQNTWKVDAACGVLVRALAKALNARTCGTEKGKK